MNRLAGRFGKLITASFAVMAIGIIVFLLAIPLYVYFDIDTDIFGFIIFTVGLALCIIGIIRRNKLHGWKLVVLSLVTAVLFLPALSAIVSLIYLLITGKELGS